MKKELIICLLTIVVITIKSQTPVPTYCAPNIGFVNYLSSDVTISSVSTDLDASSKVYTTGRKFVSTEDIVTQCTDSTGAIVWTDVYDNGGYDSPSKVRIDGSGNTFFTGMSQNGGGGDYDWVTRAIGPTGSVIWTKNFDNGFGSDDIALDLKIDIYGDVYVTGKAKNGSGYWNAITVKYQGTNGNQLWKHTFSGAGADDIGVCLTLANNQTDVIVAGTTNNGSDDNIAIYQVNAATGSPGWVQNIGGTSSSNDKVSSIILSGANVVIAGMLDNTGTGKDYVIAKLDAMSGSPVWQQPYDFSSSDRATSLVRDSTGNLIVTGTVFNSGTSLYEYHTAFFDSLGNNKWVHKKEINCSSLNVDPAIVVDTIVNHIYISGEIGRASRDILVYQLTPSGNVGWQKTFDRPGANGTDVATNLVVNGVGVVFVSANTYNGYGFDLTTMKIVQTPVYFPPDYGTPELKGDFFVFQENRGQLLHPNGTSVGSDTVVYYNQGSNPSYYFNNSMVSHILFDRDTIQDSTIRVDLKFVGANSLTDIFQYNPIDAKKHYFTTSALGITNVNSYERLFIPEIYPNIDLHHYSNTSGLKSYFVFKQPFETINVPRLQVDGADSSAIRSGYLIAYTQFGEINMGQVIGYQPSVNPLTYAITLSPISVSWNKLSTNVYGFTASGYNPYFPLCIYVSKPGATSATAAPPIGNLYWSTFIGNQGDDELVQSNTDAKDNYYTCGYTAAAHFPIGTGGYFSGPSGPSSIQYGIMSKFRSDGKLLHGTYIGGPSSHSSPAANQVLDLTVDSLYSVYLVGLTTSYNFPIKTKSGAINYTANGATSGGCQNAFIAKLDSSCTFLQYSSYYGGTGPEKFTCVDYKNGQIHIGGNSASSSIPLVTPLPNTTQYSTGGGMYVHLDTAGAIIHNTKIHDAVVAGAVDNNGNYYMLSSVYPSTGSGMPVIAPAGSFYTSSYNGNWDWGLQRMSAGDSLNWSTPIGGSSSDFPSGICIRDSVMALCGYGSSTNWPFLVNAGDSGDVTFGGGGGSWDVQLMKLNLKTGARLWSAYHGTHRNELPSGLAIDKDYNMLVTGAVDGTTSFKTLAATGYYQQNSEIGTDGFMLGYNSHNQRMWTTFFGSLATAGNGLDYDYPTSIVLNHSGKVFISGQTNAKTNSLPMVRWNSVCYYDSVVADGYTSSNNDGFISMFDVSELKTVGIKEYDKTGIGNGLTLFPNPNNGIFNLKFNSQPQENLNLNVINIMGQKVFEKNNIRPEGNDLMVELGVLSKGIYLINISDTHHSTTLKFVVN